MGTANPNVIHRRRIGRYETLFRIAAGGMAEVYAGRVTGEAGFEKLVAVKSMLPNIAEDEEFTQMFLDEARLAANIDHPNVVSTRDLGRDGDGSLFIVMDLVVGVTLSKLLRNSQKAGSKIQLPIAVELLAQAAAGLDAAHNAVTPLGDRLEIVHRDVSPQNVLVGVDGRTRITDFGVARALQRITHTTGDRFKGKFGYSAPEQLQGSPLDCRADVFSLGIVAWEMLTYRRLFAGRTPAETVALILGRESTDVRTYREEVPEDLATVVASCLRRDPEGRPSSGAELENRLRACLVGLGGKPRASEIGNMVTRFGGESLQALRENIHMSLSLSLPSPADLEMIDDSGEMELSSADGAVFEAGLETVRSPDAGETVSLSSADESRGHLEKTTVAPPPRFARRADEVSGVAVREKSPTVTPSPRSNKILVGIVVAALLVVGAWVLATYEDSAVEPASPPIVTESLGDVNDEPTPAVADASPVVNEPGEQVGDAGVQVDVEPEVVGGGQEPGPRRPPRPTGGSKAGIRPGMMWSMMTMVSMQGQSANDQQESPNTMMNPPPSMDFGLISAMSIREQLTGEQ